MTTVQVQQLDASCQGKPKKNKYPSNRVKRNQFTHCSIPGCNNEYHALGYCEKHYMQLRRYGKIQERNQYTLNEITIKGDEAEIALYNNQNDEIAKAIIDQDDKVKIQGFKWFKAGRYAAATIEGKIVCLHHFVLGLKKEKGVDVDHINGDGLYNRKRNLRVCSHRQNTFNSFPREGGTSIFKGVSWDNSRQRWSSKIGVRGKTINLGRYEDEKDAAKVYDRAAVKHFGEFARLNFP